MCAARAGGSAQAGDMTVRALWHAVEECALVSGSEQMVIGAAGARVEVRMKRAPNSGAKLRQS